MPGGLCVKVVASTVLFSPRSLRLPVAFACLCPAPERGRQATQTGTSRWSILGYARGTTRDALENERRRGDIAGVVGYPQGEGQRPALLAEQPSRPEAFDQCRLARMLLSQ